MRKVVLYHGNNGDHEFWEAHNSVCIVFARGVWNAYRMGFGPPFLDTDDTVVVGDLESITEKLRLIHRIELQFATDHVWVESKRKNARKMVLRKVEV